MSTTDKPRLPFDWGTFACFLALCAFCVACVAVDLALRVGGSY